jgi:acyl-coenzyme A synthetase/AMP-(fatty) acid ligase
MAASLDQLTRDALASGAPGETVIDYDGRAFTRGWLRDTARSIIDILAEIATKPDGLGFVARNRPWAIAAVLGMIAGRRTISMIYGYQSPEALAETITRLGLQAVVLCEEDLSPPVREAAEREGISVVAVDEQGATLAIPGHTAGTRPETEAEPCIRLLTSGTTGKPKHYPMTYAAIAGFAQDGAAGIGARKTGIPMLFYYPLANISGAMTLLPPFLAGRSFILLDRFDVHRWRDFTVRYRSEQANLPPAGFGMVLDAGIPPEDLASVRLATTGSAALDPAIQLAFEQKYGVKILTAYGATEFAGTAAAWTEPLYDEWIDKKRGSVGRACAGVTIRVLDPETDAVLPPGQVGVMNVQIARLGPNWIKTTDLGLIDEDGFVYLRGRADGAVMRGGFKVLPETIESVLLSHPEVAAAAVVGVPDRRLGAVPVALVQPASGAAPDPEALEAHIRRHLPATHVPTRLWIVERIPRTPSLKIDRAGVRAEAERRMAATADS